MEFVGYDFNRPYEFKSARKYKLKQYSQGRLWVDELDGIKDNSKYDYTPTPTDLLHTSWRFSRNTIFLGDALEQGYLDQITYRQAYEKVGLYSKYRGFLEGRKLSDMSVYTVTPKGNGIIWLIGDSGDRQENKKESRQLNPVLRPA